MPTSTLTGSRIREKRLDRGLRQAAVAAEVGISPSYLNLIEHNRRRIGGKLLADLARVLQIEPSLLTEGVDSDLLDQMRAAAARFGDMAEVARVEDVATRFPGWSALVAAQERRIAALDDQMRVLSDRVAYDPHLANALHDVISAVTAIRSSASILVGQEQLDADWQRRFHENIDTDSRRLAASSEALIAYLETPEADSNMTMTPLEEVEAFVAAHGHQFGQLEEADADIDRFVEGARLSPAAAKLLGTVATTYQADAQTLPLDAFAAAASDLAYDPVGLCTTFSVSFERALRRLSTLRSENGHPPMALAICDASGSLTFLKSVPGFSIPRFGGACPLWPVFAAFARPAQPIRAHVEVSGPVATQMLCYAIASPVGEVDFGRPLALKSTMLVMPDPPNLGTAPIPVGTSCRICPRETCTSRREPAIAGVGPQNSL